eukprot:gnl/Spiro4/22585_TR11139_c0_g1_i2.p1 gnl/Spiro4/22585_TR11139_c0_g1~~gnl/Spiro4/22585_TR11139_c0_g1_i2.p1  ORF type:complete len:309 (+),score=64.92 gnl/Spiro4/22585_TR11139_c0_g1_i2:33-929(+)
MDEDNPFASLEVEPQPSRHDRFAARRIVPPCANPVRVLRPQWFRHDSAKKKMQMEAHYLRGDYEQSARLANEIMRDRQASGKPIGFRDQLELDETAARSLWSLRRPEEALVHARRLQNTSDGVVRHSSMVLLARILAGCHLYPEAAGAYQCALTRRPRCVESWFELAQCYSLCSWPRAEHIALTRAITETGHGSVDPHGGVSGGAASAHGTGVGGARHAATAVDGHSCTIEQVGGCTPAEQLAAVRRRLARRKEEVAEEEDELPGDVVAFITAVQHRAASGTHDDDDDPTQVSDARKL